VNRRYAKFRQLGVLHETGAGAGGSR